MNIRSLITACLVVLAAALPAVLVDIEGAPLWLAQGGDAVGQAGKAPRGDTARPGTAPVPETPRF